MRVARHHRVNAWQGGQTGGGVFVLIRGIGRFDPRMGESHNDLGPSRAQSWHQRRGRGHDLARLQRTAQHRTIPLHDLRRGQPDHADPAGPGLAVMADQIAGQDGVGQQEGCVLRGVRPQLAHDIGQHDRKAGTRKHCLQIVEPIVEFVISKRRGVVSQRVHRRQDRMRLARRDPPLARDVIPQRIALQKIAIVQQQAVLHLPTGFGDQLRRAGQTHVCAGRIGKIIIAQHIHMQIRGGQDAQCGARSVSA